MKYLKYLVLILIAFAMLGCSNQGKEQKDKKEKFIMGPDGLKYTIEIGRAHV